MKHQKFLIVLSWIESDLGVKLTKENIVQHYRQIMNYPNIGKVYFNQLRTHLDTV